MIGLVLAGAIPGADHHIALISGGTVSTESRRCLHHRHAMMTQLFAVGLLTRNSVYSICARALSKAT